MENGFELDNVEPDWLADVIKNVKDGYDALPENARPVIVPPIGEPDAASIDEIPTPMVTLDQVIVEAESIQYWYLVESENNKHWKKWYDGHNAADAMAAYTAAILDGEEYVMLESLRTGNHRR